MPRGCRWWEILSCLAFVFLGLPVPAQTQHPLEPSIDRLMDSLSKVRTFKEVAISPDGANVGWVEKVQGKDREPSENTAIYVSSSRPPATPRRIAVGTGGTPHSEHDLAWSPDAHWLAFLSDREQKGQLQLYVASLEGGAPRQLTHVKGLLADPRWSPDGKNVAVLFTENLPRSAGPLEAKPPVSGVIEDQIFEQRIATVEVGSARFRPISPPDLYVYEYDWSPDGGSFIATAAHGDGDNNWWIAQIYKVTVANGETKSILKPPLQIAVPRWSPDGKAIAFIGGLMSDQGITGGDVFMMPADGGEPVNLTPDMKASASGLHWLPSSREVLFEENVDGETGVASVDISTHHITTLWRGAETISSSDGWTSASLGRNGKASAVIRSSLQHPPEVWAGEIGAWKQITHVNDSQHPMWGEARSLHWTSDEINVQGWLLYPHPYNPQRKYPLVVYVHGGPSNIHRLTWPDTFFNFTALSSEGYFVLFPNPRGSYGAGEAYTGANVKDFGYGDFRDILAGVEEVVRTFPVDADRIGIGGWSYGGYMTMWGVTQTHRFRAAVAGAGIMNWQSYYGENGIDQWMIPFFGASVYDDPAIYARSAPITFIKKAKTPTLVLVGDGDVECPTPQSFEFWHALRTLGVKTQLVVYKNEGHLIAQPKHRLDIMKRTIAWFNENLK
jgi:dipeptidyl aminopeptidase/acylaminoacyl peptidase